MIDKLAKNDNSQTFLDAGCGSGILSIAAKKLNYQEVTAFDFDPDAERLTLAAMSPLGGSWPRDFTFLPGERIALACLERAGEVRSFSYNRETGGFSPLPHVFRTHRPVVAVT